MGTVRLKATKRSSKGRALLEEQRDQNFTEFIMPHFHVYQTGVRNTTKCLSNDHGERLLMMVFGLSYG